MPAPTIVIPVEDSSAGRRIYKDSAEDVLNQAFEELFNMLEAIPAGPQGERGPVGLQGERWIVGATREFAEGLVCQVGNAVYRRFPAANAVGLFRCLQNTTTNASNFPASLTSNSTWELILTVPRGDQGETGATGPMGPSPEIVEFNTDAEALAYSQANPSAIVISLEGL